MRRRSMRCSHTTQISGRNCSVNRSATTSGEPKQWRLCWTQFHLLRRDRIIIQQAVEHERNAGKRKDLFGQYMEKLCGAELKLEKRDFLGRGEDAGGKGDFQGCSEFSPVLIFSQEEQKKFDRDKDKTARNDANKTNRRVVVLIFRKGSRVTPSKWPCPRVNEGVAGCRKRFWSDGERRRSERLPDKQRKFEESRNTFACRFYQRLTDNSPCEREVKTFQIRLYDGFGRFIPSAPFEVTYWVPGAVVRPSRRTRYHAPPGCSHAGDVRD